MLVQMVQKSQDIIEHIRENKFIKIFNKAYADILHRLPTKMSNSRYFMSKSMIQNTAQKNTPNTAK